MVQITYAAVLAFAVAAFAQLPDPSQDKNFGNGQHKSSIGGKCKSTADCENVTEEPACCAFFVQNGVQSTDFGVCSGAKVDHVAPKAGCGFGDGGSSPSPSTTAAAASPTTGPAGTATPEATPDPVGDKNIGNGQGQQFITGQCKSSADCGSACCAFIKQGTGVADFGICSGPGASTQAGKAGCGFGDAGAQPQLSGTALLALNSTASRNLNSTASLANLNSTAPLSNLGGRQVARQAPQGAPPVITINNNEPGAKNVGLKNGQQFITGQCTSDEDCASGCCTKKDAKCGARAPTEQAPNSLGCGYEGRIAPRSFRPRY
ncbi:hypothetical protein F4779DRAFT_265081 [Xylariaceae sp. FL0662B]|nr:hypothetical protein F4779DRAFT_265081 [Xylariaceae sp. FL0662B]